MPISRGLQRLCRIREAEEHQRELALLSGLQELQRFENALQIAQARARSGRQFVNQSVYSGNMENKVAGLEEIAAADRLSAFLAKRIEAANRRVTEIRNELLAVRVKRRQAETLLEEAAERDSAEIRRRSQMTMDEWYRLHAIGKKSSQAAAIEPTHERRIAPDGEEPGAEIELGTPPFPES